jgi:hypothetical protein
LDPLEKQVSQLASQGKYPEAEIVAKKMVDIVEKGFGPEHPLLPLEFRTLGWLQLRQAKYREAELHYKPAFRTGKHVLSYNRCKLG